MARQRRVLNTGDQVYQHHKLTRITEDEIRKDPGRILTNADAGVQTAIVGPDGKTVRAIVGLNGTRYLPDPDDPLEDILRAALAKSAQEKK